MHKPKVAHFSRELEPDNILTCVPHFSISVSYHVSASTIGDSKNHAHEGWTPNNGWRPMYKV